MASSGEELKRPSMARLRLPLVVLAVGLLLTAFATSWVAHATQAALEARFRNAVRDTGARVEKRLMTYVALLDGTSGLFASVERVTPEKFRTYIRRLDLESRYPGVRGVGFAEEVRRDDAARVEQRAREEGFDDFRIWPRGDSRDLHIARYLEPMDERNRAALGYDMASEPTRLEAMERARDSGRAALSGRVRLVQEIREEKQAGFLIYVPLYTTGEVPTGVEERREALFGFAYSAFRADDLFTRLYDDDTRPPVRLRLYDGEEAVAAALLHDSQVVPSLGEAAKNPAFTELTTVRMLGRPWTLSVDSLPALEDVPERFLAPAVLLFGTLMSLLLFSLMRAQNAARQRAEDLVTEMSARSKERSRLLAKEQSAREEAERANRLKDEFLATVSHELRTPLSAIIGWTHILRRGQVTPERLARGLEVVGRSAQTQAQLIEDLLDVSRVVAGKLRLQIAPVDLGQVIDAALESVRHAAEAKSITLERNVGSGVAVMGDATRLQQVIWNLLSNAVKFTPKGGRVSVDVKTQGSGVEIAVTDTGKGIRGEFLPHVFERFRQGDGGTAREFAGLGLGLSIVRHLVELHGGTVEARSEGDGLGASFVVSLPLSSARQPDAVEIAARGEPLRSPAELRGVRVLVVDDEADARELLEELLGECGMQVTTASSSSEALCVLRREPPELLVSDIGMPGEDGCALIERARAQAEGGDVPAVALTAFAREEDRSRVLLAGFDAHLSKPVNPEELLATLVALRRRARP